jgi:putative ABC transport system permease protein
MNLSTARSLTRAKEVGLRKSSGASRFQLIMQFLAESFLMTGISVLLAFGIVDYLLPWFNEYAGIKSSLSWSDWKVWAGGASAVFTLGMISGSYPAFVMSKYNPTRVLKGKFSGSREGVWLRKALVVLQFSVSVVMIAGTLLMYQQLDYLDQKDLGFQKEQIVVVPIKGDHVRNRYIALKDQLSGISGVTRVTAASNYPGGSFNQQPIQWHSNDQRISVSVLRTDFNFSETLDINIVEGRSFSQEYGEDRGGTYMLNETAAQLFDWDDPVGNEITFFDDEITRRGKVIGIVEDFHFQSLHQTVSPLLIQVMPDDFNYVLVKLQPENVSQQLASIEETWVKFDPLFAFEYSFLDAEFEANYRKEQKAGSILFMFSALAIFIATLGLLGLTSFAVQNRTKEIGVRKILGASIASIVALLSKDFVKLVLIGFVIAIPIAWYTMNQWLADFAYRTEIGLGNFILAGAAALLIAIITVSWQTIRAAVSNPVDSLRSE